MIASAFALLQALRAEGGEARLTTLARRTGLPNATASRLLRQLAEVGAVEQRDRRYVIGRALHELGEAWEPFPGLRLAARKPLRELARTGASLVLVAVRDGELTVLDHVEPPGAAAPIDPRQHASGLVEGLAAERVAAVRGAPDAHHSCAAASVAAGEGGDMVAVAALLPGAGPVEWLAGPVARVAAAIGRRTR